MGGQTKEQLQVGQQRADIIRRLHAKYPNQLGPTKLARRFGISRDTVWRILKGIRYNNGQICPVERSQSNDHREGNSG